MFVTKSRPTWKSADSLGATGTRVAQNTLGGIIALLVVTFAQASESPRVTVLDADGRTTSGTLQTWSSETLSVRDTETQSWKWRDIVRLRFDDRPVPAEARGSAIWLANGDRLVAKVREIADEQLTADWPRFPDSPALMLPLESVRGVVVSLPQARDVCDQMSAWLLDRNAARDEVRLLNGDSVSGEFASWQAGRVALTSGTNDVTLAENEVRLVGFNTELLSASLAKELSWQLSLNDGSQLTLSAAKSRLDGGTLKGTLTNGAACEVPWAAVCEVRVLRGRAVWLSEVTPTESQYTPFLPNARRWPARANRSAAGGPLRLGGREFSNGIGMHSRSVVTYELPPNTRFFTTVVGLDDTTTGEGTVACAVELDGRRAFELPRLTRDAGPQQLPRIDVSAAKRLTLIVDFGELGDVQDHVNWCDAVLLR